MKRSTYLFPAYLLLAACSAPASDNTAARTSDSSSPAVIIDAESTLSLLEAASASDIRSDDEKARDKYRNPIETLEFFGIEPDFKVVEAWPGGGWYTNILAPYLASGEGTLVAASWDPEAFEGERRDNIIERIEAFKQNYDDPRFGTLEYSSFSGSSEPLTEAGTADLVLTLRNLHNWMSGNYADKFFSDAYDALKPGGVLGVVEHRLPSTAEQDPKGSSGYVHEDYVKALAIAAGFEFASSSEVNANASDTADHPFGVWTLPPNSRTADRDGQTPSDFDSEVYQAIGESDRMTLKFVKPS